MTAVSINLPNNIIRASQDAANTLGLSQASFIKQAIVHELQNMESQFEQQAMAKGFAAMKHHPNYLKESEEIELSLGVELPPEQEAWWKK